MSFKTARTISAPPAQVYAAFTDPARLARWWGPAGFSNTFKTCELKNGGSWVYTMHGPGDKHYPNESVFRELSPSRIVIHHVSQPRYLLTIGLEAVDGGTRVSWDQAFEDPRVAAGIEHIVVPANEQNLDRWTAEVLLHGRADAGF